MRSKVIDPKEHLKIFNRHGHLNIIKYKYAIIPTKIYIFKIEPIDEKSYHYGYSKDNAIGYRWVWLEKYKIEEHYESDYYNGKKVYKSISFDLEV